MPDSIDDFLEAHGHVGSRRDLVALIGRNRFDGELKRGRLRPVFPRAYARPWDLDQNDVRQRAALLSVGGEAALSHTTALARVDLPAPPDGPLHVTAYNPRHPRGVPGELVVHRTLLPLDAREIGGLPVVRPEVAAVMSWPLLAGSDQRAPLIEGTRRRLLLPQRAAALTEKMIWLKGVRDLRALLGLLLAGCESELELWGYTDVFNVPGLNDAARQRVVRVGDRTYRLDMAYEAEMLAVELDGRAYHASPAQWERDIARDLELAKIGWQTIRLSQFRLTHDVDGCRRDVLAVRAARRLLAG
jgi:very-short-patch-repair endonuclease